MEPTSTVTIAAAPARVFDVLVDPANYPRWLVGADRIRSIDDRWPAVGSRFRHRVGRVVLGSTSVRASRRPELLELAAGIGPFGEARVRFRLRPVRDGTTELTVHELPSRGLARLLWWVGRPAVRAALWGRNQWSLNALRDLVERTGAPGDRDPAR